MAVSEVSTAESAFCGTAEAPRGAGARAAGDGATWAARPRKSLVFPAVGQVAGSATMDASVAVALRKDAVKESLWRAAAGDPALLALLRELDDVLEVRFAPPTWPEKVFQALTSVLISGGGEHHGPVCGSRAPRVFPIRPGFC